MVTQTRRQRRNNRKLGRGKVRTTWGKMGTNPSPVMKSIGLVTPRTLGRSGLFKLGPRILCKQGSIKMTPKVDLVSRTKLAKHPVELRKVSIFNTAKSGPVRNFTGQHRTPS
jgi:hypothetical protein